MPISARSVLLITPRWIRDGGVGTHAIASAAALAERGVSVNVLAARVDADVPAAGVTVMRGPRLFDERASPESRLGDAMSCEPETIHLHQFDDPEVVELMRRRAPVVISTHGYTACTSGVHHFRPGQECGRAHGVGCIPNLAFRGCAHTRHLRPLPASYKRATRALAALRIADLAVSYSSAVDRHLGANGISRREVVPLFTTMTPKRGEGHAERRRVVFAGRVVPPKGLGVLLHAARTVDAKLVVCGDGRQLPAMRRLAQRLGLSERVRFTGWLGAEELAHELAEASVVALPSIWPEPFGLVGIEALAAGRPVIASVTGGVGDWLQDGVNGLGVAPGNASALARALDELLADPERQARMGADGREMVSARFSKDRHVAALQDAYRRARETWSSRRGEHDPGHDAGATPSEAPRVRA